MDGLIVGQCLSVQFIEIKKFGYKAFYCIREFLVSETDQEFHLVVKSEDRH